MKTLRKDQKDCPSYIPEFIATQTRKFGSIINFSNVWGQPPKLFQDLSCLFGLLKTKPSTISPFLRSLIIFRVSQLNGSKFCIRPNSATLLERGISLSKIEKLVNWKRSKLFTDKEKIALEYAETLTKTDKKVSEEVFKKLREHFQNDQILELAAIITFQNMSTKYNKNVKSSSKKFCKH